MMLGMALTNAACEVARSSLSLERCVPPVGKAGRRSSCGNGKRMPARPAKFLEIGLAFLL